MSVPSVVIVGRPNVGKSALFNRLTGRRIAIVDPMAGVTRDRLSAMVRHEGVVFELVDTGGMGIKDSDGLTADIERQIHHAIARATLIVFVVDVRDGPVPLDNYVSQRLRKIGIPVILVVNKCDTAAWQSRASDFFSLGWGEPFPMASLAGFGRTDLLDRIRSILPVNVTGEPVPPMLHLAVVGHRNAGKSTYVNALAGEERVIVSEVPGTTRDSVDCVVQKDDRSYVIVDTPGMRRRREADHRVEVFGQLRTENAIRRADVVLFLLDAALEVSEVDKRIGSMILESGKPVIVGINKIDLIRDPAAVEKRYRNYLDSVLPGLPFAPRLLLSAKTGKHVWEALPLAETLAAETRITVPTAELNRLVEEYLSPVSPQGRPSRAPRIYYATQTGQAPPTFAFFVNDPALFRPSHRRTLLSILRDHLPCRQVPIEVHYRKRRK
ncbi:MAG: ribosome biogenesis GTPase Der [Planctomycetota bacterium]